MSKTSRPRRTSRQLHDLTTTDTPTPRPKALLTRAHLADVTPLTDTQRACCQQYAAGAEVLLWLGTPGTGKTFLAVSQALHDALHTKRHQRIVLVRSAVPSRSVGYLPGTEEDKLAAYQAPYRDICARLFTQVDAYARLVAQGTLEFVSTSYLRGMTWDDAIVIVDECQNMSDMELHTIMTRLGQRSRIIFCGDQGQTDLQRVSDRSGWPTFSEILQAMPMTQVTYFTPDDIVRSPVIKAYILARDAHGMSR